MVSTSVRALIPPKYIDVFREVKVSALKPVETDFRSQKRLTIALFAWDKYIRIVSDKDCEFTGKTIVAPLKDTESSFTVHS